MRPQWEETCGAEDFPRQFDARLPDHQERPELRSDDQWLLTQKEHVTSARWVSLGASDLVLAGFWMDRNDPHQGKASREISDHGPVWVADFIQTPRQQGRMSTHWTSLLKNLPEPKDDQTQGAGEQPDV